MNAAIQLREPASPLRQDVKLAGLLGLLGALATAALFPYLLLVIPEALAKLDIPLWIAIPVQATQAGLLLTLLSLCGLRMGHRVGLGVPWLRAKLFGGNSARQPWMPALLLGMSAGLMILALDPLFAPHMPATIRPQAPTAGHASALAGFLASFYGGIAEELQLRLFAMTLLAWLLVRFAPGWSAPLRFWLAITLAAALFGAGHLPAAAQIWPLDAVVITRILVLNGVGGLVFGWYYWKHGLETAMLAHFGADLVLHVFAPLAMA